MADGPTQEQIDEMMRQLAASGAVEVPPPAGPKATPVPLELEPLSASASPPRGENGLDLLSDVDVELRVELGSTRLNVQEVLKLGSGSVVPMDSLAGDPACVYVNDRLVARGEVLVVDDCFAIRITEVLSPPRTEAAPGG
jgi:flagellar motor switch protein FliN/FliY